MAHRSSTGSMRRSRRRDALPGRITVRMIARRAIPQTLSALSTPAARATVGLFAVDSVTNVIDYGFHVFLGRALTPGGFAVVQTINSVLLILITAFGVTQPVVARFVAEARAGPAGGTPERAWFQAYFRTSAILGILLGLAAWWLRIHLARWLNVPTLALSLVIVMIPLSLLRPVVAGMLQGQGRMIPFGLTRTFNAVARFAVAALLIGLGAGILGAIISLPAGSLLALVGGLGLVGLAAWKPSPAVPANAAVKSLGLTVTAFIAYAAYMSLLNSDMIWVNRIFAPETAGSYATAVLLRRVLALMPGAVIVVMYPRAVAKVARLELPDGLLAKTAAVVAASTLLLTAVYFVFGPVIVQAAFGANYPEAGSLLGWMGIAMLGYGFCSIWLSFYLATRPLPFVTLLCIVAVGQHLMLKRFHGTLLQTTCVFLAAGWVLALGGLLIYLLVLRPQLISRRRAGSPLL
jgi:O-antigen/teichoic acid export membrane protein